MSLALVEEEEGEEGVEDFRKENRGNLEEEDRNRRVRDRNAVVEVGSCKEGIEVVLLRNLEVEVLRREGKEGMVRLEEGNVVVGSEEEVVEVVESVWVAAELELRVIEPREQTKEERQSVR